MADAITWKFVSREQVELLAQRHSVDDCKSELAQIFKLDGNADANKTTNCYFLDCYLYSYSFARQQHLRADQISVLLGILHCLMVADFGYESTTTITSSYAHFQSLLLAHSVDRPPKSVQIFSASDVASIVDFVAHSYFRHFHLFKCIFTPFYHTHLVQKHSDGVQIPPLPRPLSDAFLHPEPPQPPQDTQPMDQATLPQVETTTES